MPDRAPLAPIGSFASDIEFSHFAGLIPWTLGFTQLSELDFIGQPHAWSLVVVPRLASASTGTPLTAHSWASAETGGDESASPLTGDPAHVTRPRQWITGLAVTLGDFLRLPRGWNRDAAPPISAEAARSALELALNLDTTPATVPQVVPTQAGGIQFEWHLGRIDLEIELEPSGEAELWYVDDETGTEREGRIAPGHAIDDVNALLAVIDSRIP